MTKPVPITIAVEGIGDAAIAERLCSHCGLESGKPYVANGKNRLDLLLKAYNNAAHISPWLVLRDLDHDADCAAALRHRLLPDEAEQMYLRIPVRSIEAWLLGDTGKESPAIKESAETACRYNRKA